MQAHVAYSGGMAGRVLTQSQRAAARASRKRMMERARMRGRVGRYWVQTLALVPVAALLRLLPVEMASDLGGWVVRRMIRRFADRSAIHRTLRVPFPNLTDADADRHLAEMSENLGRVLGESVHLGAFAGAANPRLRLAGLEHVEAARAGGRGVLFIGGHFANWELFEVALAGLGLEGAKVLQHPSNPFVLEPIAHARYRHGLAEQIATGEGVFVRVCSALRAGRAVQMLSDQRTSKGAKVPFFGLATTTNLVPARAARETGAPIVLMSMRRLGPARFEIAFQPPLAFGPDADEVEIMTMVNRFYESEIRATPSHWLWGHPRWDDVFLDIPPKPLLTPPRQ